MKTILKVVVGSRLHGLNKPDSDYDYRGIFMHPMIDMISPFRKPKNTSWIEGDEDNTAYELREFAKMATYGNPTILEILWSNKIEQTSKIGEILRDNRHKFLDSTRIFEAHKGYAHNQYAKAKLFDPDERTPKFIIAYLRSLEQAAQLLGTGDFNPVMEGELKDFMLEVKYQYGPHLGMEVTRRMTQAQQDLIDAYAHNQETGGFRPDIPWIENFLMGAYSGEYDGKKINSLLEDVYAAKFGTKNRAELILRLTKLTDYEIDE